MNLVIGILLFGLGLVTLVAWFGEMLPFLKGLLVCSLLFWGAVAMVVGATQRRSRAQLERAKADEPSGEEGAVSGV